MFLRLLFVLLMALNIAVGAWLVLGQDDALVRSAADPGVPELHLLSERPPTVAAPAASVPAPAVSSVSPAAASSAALATNPAVPPAVKPDSYTCLAVGPFATPQDLRNARATVGAQSVRTRSRPEQSQQSRGWWVYLPAAGSRAQALAEAQRLSARHIDDYFVVSSGDQPNTISLGLFKDPANARKRRDEVAAAGFPAQMSERVDTVPEYWLDVVVADSARGEWRQRVRSLGAGTHATGCF
jgi:hypothetical protein